MTLHSEVSQQHRAVLKGVGLIDRSDRGILVVSGGDRYTWLQGMVSNDVRPLAEGAPGVFACILDATGHLRTELRVVRREDDLLLDLPRQKATEILALLDGFIVMEDVEISDHSDRLAVLSVQGSRVSREMMHHLGSASTVIEADHTGEGGFDIYRPVEHMEEFRARLVAELGAVPVGEEAAEILRIEAGIPKFGVDMDEKTIPLEAGLEETHISHTKGCYVGQEIIARIVARGHTNRRLTGLVIDGDDLPDRGDVVRAIDGEEAKDAGWITSACRSIARGTTIALGYVRHEQSEPGTGVLIHHDGGFLEAKVAELPFGGS